LQALIFAPTNSAFLNNTVLNITDLSSVDHSTLDNLVTPVLLYHSECLPSPLAAQLVSTALLPLATSIKAGM
jgi:hypothetical protein